MKPMLMDLNLKLKGVTYKISDITYSTFLASSQLTMSNHRPYYCTVHVLSYYSFLSVCGLFECSESVQVLRLFVYTCISIRYSIITRGGKGISFTCLTLSRCCACPKPGLEVSNAICCVLFCVQ